MNHDLADFAEPDAKKKSEALSEWLVSFSRTEEYKHLVARCSQGDYPSITSAYETAMIFAIIQRLQPEMTLEIGTFFARTTRIMAEAIVEGGGRGRVITLDPFGEHRVPGILESWPEPLRAVTDFQPWNSMQYFLELETLGTPRGANSPLGVIFVDGHHSFEYALFDIIRSADHVAPDGLIIVDNLEQQGPRAAVIQFLRWNPAWRLFCKGDIFSKGDLGRTIFVEQADDDASWGILLPPAGLQVSSNVVKVMRRGIQYVLADELHLHLNYLSHPGSLHLTFVYFATPYDYHLTGKDMSIRRYKGKIPVPALTSLLKVKFPETLTLELVSAGSNVSYEAEIFFESDASADAYILLDDEHPISLISA